jgi:hypothetical protein
LTAATVVVAGAVEGVPTRPGRCAKFINNPVQLRLCRQRNKNSNSPNTRNNHNNIGHRNPFANGFGSISNIRFGPEFAQQFAANNPIPDGVEVDEDNEGAEEMANAAYTSLFGSNSESLPNLSDSNSFKRSSFSLSKPAKCAAEPKKTGVCRAMFHRFSYDAATDSCVQFVYGGCSGNANNFVTQDLCEKACLNENYNMPDVVAKSALNNVKKNGNGRSYGNRNWNKNGWNPSGLDWNFGFASDLAIPLSESEAGKRNPCNDPPIDQPGMCRALIRTFTYIKDSNSCVPAAFGGCAMGTTNSFATIEDCKKECTNKIEADQGYTLDQIMNKIDNDATAIVTEYDSTITFDDSCSTENPCGCPKNVGLTMGKKSKMFYYNASSGQCETLIYRGFMGNANRFATYCECTDKCGDPKYSKENTCEDKYYENLGLDVPEKDNKNDSSSNKPAKNSICMERMAETGFCRAMIQVYSYNKATKKCEMKVNGGCDAGTKNFFYSISECRDECEASESEETSVLDTHTRSGAAATSNDNNTDRCLKSFNEPDLTAYYGETYGYLVFDQEKQKCRKIFYKEPVQVFDEMDNLFPSFPRCREACEPNFVKG